MVLAKKRHSISRLLGCGYEELEWDDMSMESENWAEAQKFRDWMAAKLGLECPPTGAEIVTIAQDKHPDFGDWVRNWQDSNL